MILASWVEYSLGFCCLIPAALIVLAVWAINSLGNDAIAWFKSDDKGVVGEIVNEIAEEVATSWLEEQLRRWLS